MNNQEKCDKQSCKGHDNFPKQSSFKKIDYTHIIMFIEYKINPAKVTDHFFYKIIKKIFNLNL